MIPLSNYLTILLKAFFVIGSLLYLIFAFIISRQVSVMTKSIHDKFDSVLMLMAYVHLIGAIFLVFLTIFFL